jgi:hypothetical protein
VGRAGSTRPARPGICQAADDPFLGPTGRCRAAWRLPTSRVPRYATSCIAFLGTAAAHAQPLAAIGLALSSGVNPVSSAPERTTCPSSSLPATTPHRGPRRDFTSFSSNQPQTYILLTAGRRMGTTPLVCRPSRTWPPRGASTQTFAETSATTRGPFSYYDDGYPHCLVGSIATPAPEISPCSVPRRPSLSPTPEEVALHVARAARPCWPPERIPRCGRVSLPRSSSSARYPGPTSSHRPLPRGLRAPDGVNALHRQVLILRMTSRWCRRRSWLRVHQRRARSTSSESMASEEPSEPSDGRELLEHDVPSKSCSRPRAQPTQLEGPTSSAPRSRRPALDARNRRAGRRARVERVEEIANRADHRRAAIVVPCGGTGPQAACISRRRARPPRSDVGVRASACSPLHLGQSARRCWKRTPFFAARRPLHVRVLQEAVGEPLAQRRTRPRLSGLGRSRSVPIA